MEGRCVRALTHTFSRWYTKLLSSNLFIPTASSLDPMTPRLRRSLQRHQLKRLKSSQRLARQPIIWRKLLSHFNLAEHARGRRSWQILEARKYGSQVLTAPSTDRSARNEIRQVCSWPSASASSHLPTKSTQSTLSTIMRFPGVILEPGLSTQSILSTNLLT